MQLKTVLFTLMYVDPSPVHHARLCDVIPLTVRVEMIVYLLTYLLTKFDIYTSERPKLLLYVFLSIPNSIPITRTSYFQILIILQLRQFNSILF